jgi:hypothetical protein
MSHVALGKGWAWAVNTDATFFYCKIPCETTGWNLVDRPGSYSDSLQYFDLDVGATEVWVSDPENVFKRPINGSGNWSGGHTQVAGKYYDDKDGVYLTYTQWAQTSEAGSGISVRYFKVGDIRRIAVGDEWVWILTEEYFLCKCKLPCSDNTWELDTRFNYSSSPQLHLPELHGVEEYIRSQTEAPHISGGTCADTDPEYPGDSEYVCPSGYIAKVPAVPDGDKCTDVTTCNANCCEVGYSVNTNLLDTCQAAGGEPINDFEGCRAAAAALNKTFRDDLQGEILSYAPRGCFEYSGTNTADQGLRFNNHFSGGSPADPYHHLVCKHSQAACDTYTCPSGYSNLGAGKACPGDVCDQARCCEALRTVGVPFSLAAHAGEIFGVPDMSSVGQVGAYQRRNNETGGMWTAIVKQAFAAAPDVTDMSAIQPSGTAKWKKSVQIDAGAGWVWFRGGDGPVYICKLPCHGEWFKLDGPVMGGIAAPFYAEEKEAVVEPTFMELTGSCRTANDDPGMYVMKEATLEECRKTCVARDSCRAYGFEPDMNEAIKIGKCAIHNGTGRDLIMKGDGNYRTSCYVKAIAHDTFTEALGNCWTARDYWQYPVDKITHIDAVSVENCSRLCVENDACRAFEFWPEKEDYKAITMYKDSIGNCKLHNGTGSDQMVKGSGEPNYGRYGTVCFMKAMMARSLWGREDCTGSPRLQDFYHLDLQPMGVCLKYYNETFFVKYFCTEDGVLATFYYDSACRIVIASDDPATAPELFMRDQCRPASQVKWEDMVKDAESLASTGMTVAELAASDLESIKKQLQNPQWGGCSYSEGQCRAVAMSLGLELGSPESPFAGEYVMAGCHAYRNASNASDNYTYYGYAIEGGNITSESELSALDEGWFRPFNTHNCEASIGKLIMPGPKNVGLSWDRANRLAQQAGGRLLTSQEFQSAKLSTGDFDQWQPIDNDVGMWIQSGNAGKLYTEDGQASGGWYRTDDVHHFRPSSKGSTKGSPIDWFYYYAQACSAFRRMATCPEQCIWTGSMCQGRHEIAKCNDVDKYCCAAASWGTPPSCSDGYTPIPDVTGCSSSWELCPTFGGGEGCYGCYPPEAASGMYEEDMARYVDTTIAADRAQNMESAPTNDIANKPTAPDDKAKAEDGEAMIEDLIPYGGILPDMMEQTWITWTCNAQAVQAAYDVTAFERRRRHCRSTSSTTTTTSSSTTTVVPTSTNTSTTTSTTKMPWKVTGTLTMTASSVTSFIVDPIVKRAIEETIGWTTSCDTQHSDKEYICYVYAYLSQMDRRLHDMIRSTPLQGWIDEDSPELFQALVDADSEVRQLRAEGRVLVQFEIVPPDATSSKLDSISRLIESTMTPASVQDLLLATIASLQQSLDPTGESYSVLVENVGDPSKLGFLTTTVTTIQTTTLYTTFLTTQTTTTSPKPTTTNRTTTTPRPPSTTQGPRLVEGSMQLFLYGLLDSEVKECISTFLDTRVIEHTLADTVQNVMVPMIHIKTFIHTNPTAVEDEDAGNAYAEVTVDTSSSDEGSGHYSYEQLRTVDPELRADFQIVVDGMYAGGVLDELHNVNMAAIGWQLREVAQGFEISNQCNNMVVMSIANVTMEIYYPTMEPPPMEPEPNETVSATSDADPDALPRFLVVLLGSVVVLMQGNVH